MNAGTRLMTNTIAQHARIHSMSSVTRKSYRWAPRGGLSARAFVDVRCDHGTSRHRDLGVHRVRRSRTLHLVVARSPLQEQKEQAATTIVANKSKRRHITVREGTETDIAVH